MLTEPTFNKLSQMRLHHMARTLRDWLAQPPEGLSMLDQIGLLVEGEWIDRENRKMQRRLQEAKLPHSACLEDIVFDSARGLDKTQLRSLGEAHWITQHQNVVIVGATGGGEIFSRGRSRPCRLPKGNACPYDQSSAIAASAANCPGRRQLHFHLGAPRQDRRSDHRRLLARAYATFRVTRPARDPRGPIRSRVHHRLLSAAQQILVRSSGRTHDRRRDLRPPRPLRTPPAPQRTISPEKERPSAILTHLVASLRSCPAE